MQHFYVHFDGDPSLTLKFLLQENQQKTFKEILEVRTFLISFFFFEFINPFKNSRILLNLIMKNIKKKNN